MKKKGKKKINSRTKGHSQERKLVKKFAAWWGSDFFRTPGSGSFATMGYKGVDGMDLSGDIVTTDPTFPFCIESKKVEGWTFEQLLTSPKCKFYDWWKQTLKETPKDKIPLLVFTKNRTPEFVAIDASYMSDRFFPVPSFRLHISLERHVCIFKLDDLFKIDKDLCPEVFCYAKTITSL